MKMTNGSRENVEVGSLEVFFIMDRSGSMSGLEDDTIGGFNATLKEQKEKSGDIIWSTVLFDDRYEVIHDRVPIKEVNPITSEEYYVRGCTALLDAIGRSIHNTALIHKHARKEDVPDRTLFVITTDGMENSSREYTYRKVKRMIDKEQEKHGWEFMFLGANMDAVDVAGQMGIRPEMSATYLNDSKGIMANFGAIGSAISAMRESDDGELTGDILERVREDYRERS